jgi:predicted metalloendopeptidase
MDWPAYLRAHGIDGVETIIVTDLGYLESLHGLIEATPLETLQHYYTLEVMWSYAPYLSSGIDGISFAFWGTFLEGIMERRPLEEETLDQVNATVPDAVGRLYVESHFPPEAKEEITALVDAEIAAFRIRLQNNPWMTDETRELAIRKLDAMNVKVGYPDTWETYGNVEIGDSFAGSMQSAYEAALRDKFAAASEPVDREAWDIAVQEVNAYYNPLANEIVFPAAILQAPFFTAGGDPAANFGGIGMVIGHELTHGFDLTGSQFDADGNLVNWWVDEDLERFRQLNQAVADQYSAVEVLPGLSINGQLTVGENVADLGGVQIAYDALMIYLSEQGAAATPAASPPGTPWASPVAGLSFEDLTDEQRFFVSVATVWRMEIRDESLRLQVLTDTHAPAVARAIMPIQNMDAFHEAFDIQPGDPMYLVPENRIVIW